jgi:hypothetical protein
MEEKNIPDKFLDYLQSNNIQDIIQKISEAVVNGRNYIILYAVIDIFTKKTSPENVISYLEDEYALEERDAKILAQEIKYSILRPLAEDLLLYQIDINKIDGEEPIPQPKEQEVRPLSEKAEEPPIIFEAKEIPVSGPKPEQKETPLMIHEERTVPTSWGAQEEKKTFTSKSFSSFGFFKDKKVKEVIPEPIRAKIETFVGEKISDKDKKIVNYNEYKTPVSSFEESGQFINLDTFQVVGPKKETVSHEATIQEIQKQTPSMKQVFVEHAQKEETQKNPTPITIQKTPLQSTEPTLKTPASTNSFWGNMIKQKNEALVESEKKQETTAQKPLDGNTIDLRQ